MPALPETMTRERAGRPSTASPSVSRSLDDFQGGSSARGQSRGVCRCLPQIRPYQFRKLGRSLHHRLFSHWSRFSSVAVTNRGVSSFPRALPRVHSHDLTGANRSVVHSATRQHFSQALADVVHFDHRLSSVSDLVGIDPNENGLTHEAEPLSPDDKIHD